MEHNFYLSSHGTTYLYNLFIDKRRDPPVFPINGIPDGVHVEIHYKLKGRQMQSVLARTDSLSRANKAMKTSLEKEEYNDYMIIRVIGKGKVGIIQKVEIIKDREKFVFYDLKTGVVENVPNIEYSYEDEDFTAGLLELSEVAEDSDSGSDSGSDSKMKSKSKPKEKRKDIPSPDGKEWWQSGGGLEPVFIVSGVSQMKYDWNSDHYDIDLSENDEIKIIKYKGDPSNFFCNSEKWLYIQYYKDKKLKKRWVPKWAVKPKYYAGSAWDMETAGFLHTYTGGSWAEGGAAGPETELEQGTSDLSLLNMLFSGGRRNWDPTIYLDYPGYGNRLSKDHLNIINIYGSHCLNPEEYNEHLLFGNVIPFILGQPGLWAHVFRDELLEGANEAVEDLEELLSPEGLEANRVRILKYKLKKAEGAVKAMKAIIRGDLGPVVPEKQARKRKLSQAQLRKKTHRKKKRKTKKRKTTKRSATRKRRRR